MEPTVLEPKPDSARENTVLHFKPTQHLGAIKAAIVQQCLEKKRRQQQAMHDAHVGGLPSPPVEEEKKVATPEPCLVPMATSSEIREKIQRLTDEKHRLFQMLKQLMVQEEQKKKKKKSRWAPVSSSDQAYLYPRRYQPYVKMQKIC